MTDMKHEIQQVRGFGRYATGTSEIYWPTNEDEVSQVFDLARKAGKRIAIRGGGHSFNGQALHNRDTASQIILSSEAFAPHRIEFDPTNPNIVTLGSGVPWSRFVRKAIQRARESHAPIRIPGSLQTGGQATVAGTMAGGCLSRFSGTVGKESCWIRSFRILTPGSTLPVFASEDTNKDLFYAVIGGHGYLGFVTEVTYYVAALDGSRARTEVTTFTSFYDLVEKQLELIRHEAPAMAVAASAVTGNVAGSQGATVPFPRMEFARAVSSAWAPSPFSRNPAAIEGVVFNSYYAEPSKPKLPGFPLYQNLDSTFRYLIELAARHPVLDSLIDLALYAYVHLFRNFENNIEDFLFFMDGDASARTRFEKAHPGELFPIVQQTYVIPIDAAACFAENCMRKIRRRGLRPTECDMLFVAKDRGLLSANYDLDGFAVSFAFEPIASNGDPPAEVVALLRELSVDCLNARGRIHLPKNSYIEKQVFRSMFHGQIQRFEQIKRQHDPELLLQNQFSDQFFNF